MTFAGLTERDLYLISGASTAAGGLILSAPMFQKIWSAITSIGSSLGNMIPGKKTVAVESLDDYDLHTIVDYLIQTSHDAKDEDGVQLMVTFGKHLYDIRVATPTLKIAG